MTHGAVEKFSYDNHIVKLFMFATLLWGVVGMLVGVLAAVELFSPGLTMGIPYITFSRIRPLHTNAVIFAFVGNAMFAGIYYSLQRLCKARLFSDGLSRVHFWGWQLIIVSAALTLPFGITVSKEYAELEWPIDIAITLVWVVFGINLVGTVLKRREANMYVAIWFYLATFFTVAILHVVNSLAIPISLTKSYPVFAGVQDALTQWWYGHNAVAFFLTTPYLGMMYYFIPKAANRPVYSYRLSIVHFWALIFLYIWAGPHHLLYTALPDWAQTLGSVFSIMLIAPSWGGMLNGLLTLRGAWDNVREDAVLKFFVVALTAYGMATFEGPLMAIKTVNALSHYTDWTVGHAHIGGLGWNGFMIFAMIYWLAPRLWKTKLYSPKLANTHFWIGTLGILFYAIPLYWAGITQGLMWKEFTEEGFLKYPNFLETVTQLVPMYMLRAFGGTLYLAGMIIFVYNILMTAKQGSFAANEETEAPARIVHNEDWDKHWGMRHRWIESRPVQFMFWTFVAVAIGGVLELIPLAMIKSNVPTITSVKPYTPLELEGRDIYVREGCYTCHSQLIRPFRSETERYGEYSKPGEFVYDHPFQWGSKRTGPDLHREGGKYPHAWHYQHMLEPSSMSPGSIMPAYPWLITDILNTSHTPAKIKAMQTLGVPYPDGYADIAIDKLNAQANEIAATLKEGGVEVNADREIIAMIAYLQRLGTDIKRVEGSPEAQKLDGYLK